MKIDETNLEKLTPLQEWWYVDNNGVTKDIYLGKFGSYYIFAFGEKIIKIYEGNPNFKYHLSEGRMFTTYEEACERFRKLFLDLIDHFNLHQLKGNPIITLPPSEEQKEERVTDEMILIYFNNHSNCYADQEPNLNGKQMPIVPAMTRSAVIYMAKWLRDKYEGK